jgi:hypothetical protein
MTDILQAARSYYGLADTDVRKTDIYTNEAGQPMLVFELALSAEDFIAIGARMQNMQQPDTQPDTAIIEGPTVEAMREAYNALSKAEKGRYGSFARYMTEFSTGIIDVYTGEPYNVPAPPAPPPTRTVVNGRETKESIEATRVLREQNKASTERQVVHVDTPEEPEPTNMDAVWLSSDDATYVQRMHASDTDFPNSRYLVQWAMLTDEQKQKAKP